MTAIKENYHQNMTLAEAEKLVLTTLKQVMEEKISTDNVEVCVIPTSTKQMVYKTAAEIKTILDGIE
jgi:20S proteasome subunit alpha 5|tara:strand:+ start:370 stop:570 length:201 start_codon:yes stop_codon:yes gene_type:complete